MNLVDKFSTCSVCGKRKIIARHRDKVLNKQNRVDVYLECKDCAAIPLWDKNIEDRKRGNFDHYQ
jgi:hypothetical protein